MLLFGAVFVFYTGFAQQFHTVDVAGSSGSSSHTHSEKCAHRILESSMEKEMGYFGSRAFFEGWLDQKIEARRSQPQILSRTAQEPRLIPVVVHVIHSGQAEGQGPNIPDAQIYEQIRILNEDFRRQNADASRTPAEFLPVAADANIEFVLAKQDPIGLPTSGIVRIQGPQSSYAPEQASLIGQLSQWDPSEYLNIWVVAVNQPFIGYASFPVSDLPGLNFAPSSTITDGVTIDYRFFGTGGSAVSSSLGRTATHEVGHYLGLRHIWGDGGCDVDDFVEDTPPQDDSNTACSANVSKFSCGANNMIQNYMDYTPDACMNIFTLGQVERFNVVLENSPRRMTLVNNRATQDPVLANLDLAIVTIVEPLDYICTPAVTPSVEVINAGNNTLTSARIQFLVNGTVRENRRFTFSLATGESTVLNFNSLTLSASGDEVEFRIIQANDQEDQNPANNSMTSNPVLQQEVALPYTYNPGSFPGPWVIDNPDNFLTWQNITLPISGVSQELVYIRNYQYESPGEVDYFISPSINLSAYPNAQLVFEMAHAQYNENGFEDKLIVAVSQDCGNTFDLLSSNYDKSGFRLETSPATLEEFIPTLNSQFRTEVVNLSPYADLGSVRIAFISESSYGNNIYLKNIRILPQEEFRYELTLNELLVPTPISDGTHENEVIQVTNTGNLPISGFLLRRTANNSAPQTLVASGASVAPGETFNLTTDNSTSDGKNRLQIELLEPNFDQNDKASQVLERYLVINGTTTGVPWRASFNTSSLEPWTTVNPESDAPAWTTTSISGPNGPDHVVMLESTLPGQSYWLGSPVFDLSVSSLASVFFDLAAGAVGSETSLSLLASTNAGESYTQVWNLRGSELSTVSSGAANPNTPGDFMKKYVDLSGFAGTGNREVRLAFVLEGGVRSNPPIYLDNIELFLEANPEPVIPAEGRTVLYPNPATDLFNLSFNLPGYEDITIQVISSTGAVIQEIVYPNTLNQTYSFSTQLFRKGVYIVKVTGNSINETRRLIIN